jgi:hypothetical protein
MSFFRSVLLASLISLLAAIGLLFIGSAMGYEEFRGGYAVLITDDTIQDEAILSRLESGDLFFGGSPVSESSQWVLLDEFDSIKRIPLDQFSSRIFPFDPRNDGYAGKLRDVFVRDGKRFIYLPLFAGNWKANFLDKKFNELMGDIPVSVEYYGIGRPLSLFFIVYAAASVILLIMCYVKRKVHRSIVNIIPMIPVLSSLGFFGAAGIGSAALLFALFIMLKEPLNDLVNPPPSIKKGKDFKTIYKEIIAPYKFYWLFVPVFAAALSILVIFSQLKVLFLIAVTIASFAVFFFSLKIVIFSGVEHKRFNPLMIVRRRFPEFVFPMYILPFVIGAFLTMFFTPFMSGTYDSGNKFDAIVTEQDYYDHLTYQTSFSTRRLGGGEFSSYPAFSFDTDGLILMNKTGTAQSVKLSDFPNFPLKQLMDFFNNVNNGDIINSGKRTGRIQENLSLLVLLLFIFPGLFFRGKDDDSNNGAFDNLKKNLGKLRSIGINWNNKLLYNDVSLLRSRKDA